MILLSFFAGTRPQYSPYNAASLPIDRYLNDAVSVVMFFGLVLIATGMLGLRSRFGNALGGLGKASLLGGAIAGLVGAVGVVGLGIVDSDPWWSLFMFGMALMLLGLGLLGLRLQGSAKVEQPALSG